MYIQPTQNNQPYFGLKLNSEACKNLTNHTLEFIKNSPLTKQIDRYYPDATLYLDKNFYGNHNARRKFSSYIDLHIEQLNYNRYAETPDNSKIAISLPDGNIESFWNDLENKIREIFSSTKVLDDLQAERRRIVEYNNKHQELVNSISGHVENKTKNTDTVQPNTGIRVSIGELLIKFGNWLKK